MSNTFSHAFSLTKRAAIVAASLLLISAVTPLQQAEAQARPNADAGMVGQFATDWSRATVNAGELSQGCGRKGCIPAINNPQFVSIGSANSQLADDEPVISLTINGDARAYPLRILTGHEIVNDVVGGRAVAVTYCPLCNSAIVFDRSHNGRQLSFAVSGFLRNSDLVMYDRETESLWQQFTGQGIIGAFAGQTLRPIASRLDAYRNFKQRSPNGRVLNGPSGSIASYPPAFYPGYDQGGGPRFPLTTALPQGIAPMARVVRVGSQAFAIDRIKRSGGQLQSGDLLLTWQPGQRSGFGTGDVGTVTAQRSVNGQWVDVPYDVTFAFAFHAFFPNSRIVV